MRTHEQRPQQYLHAALVGLLAGLLAVAFRYTLEGMEGFRDVVISFGHTHPAWGWLLPIIFSAVTAGVGLFLVRRFAPEAAGSGIPHLELVLNRLHQMKWLRIILVKFSGGALSIGAGLALGREGPTVQMGGAVGQMVSEKLKNTPAENQALVSAGAGAGLAAAFNAPLSGVVFVLEELERNFTPAVFTATFIACIIADIVTRSLIGSMPTYHLASYLAPPLESLSIFLFWVFLQVC